MAHNRNNKMRGMPGRQGTLESLNLGHPPKRKKANPLGRLQQATLLTEAKPGTMAGTLQERAQERGDLGTTPAPPGARPERKKKKKIGEGFPDRSPY